MAKFTGMVARRLAAVATAALAAVAAGAASALADTLVYRCGPNVCKAAPDGTGKQRLTTDGKPGGPLYAWVSASADGSRIAVVNATFAYILDAKGRRITGKLPRGGIDVIAEMAPDGKQVATVELLPEVSPAPVGSPPGTPGLSGFVPYMFVMNADGSGREATARVVVDMTWLGARLVRTDTSDTDPFPYGICLLVTNIDFQCERDVARDPTQDLFNPAFSPDGRFAAVVRSPSTTIGAGSIVIYDAATGAPVRELVGGENTQPTWSPDGKRIAFERGGDLYVAHATGAPRARRVLTGGEQPTWTSAAACRPRRPRVRLRGRSALVTVCASQPGRLTVTLLRAGRRVARRTVTAATGGIVTVRLRRPSGARAGELRARVTSR